MVAGNVFFSLLSAYGFTLWRGQAANAVFLIYVIVMLMPLQAVIVPNYIVADQLRMRDSYLAIILPGIFAPFGTFLLRQGMKSMPQEYFEAARIDGAGEFTVFLRIVLPQIKSCIAALCMLTFIEYWNLVEQPVIFIRDYARQPLSVYLSRISETRVGVIFAASAVYMLLPHWFLAAGRENLEKGIELSGIK
jgi:multiple sugar transport system permease protein